MYKDKCLGVVLEGEGYIIYYVFSYFVYLVVGFLAALSSGIYVPRSIGSWEIHIGKDLRDNLVQLSCFSDEKGQPQMRKGPC